MTHTTHRRQYGLAGIAGRQAPYLLKAFAGLRDEGFEVVAGCDQPEAEQTARARAAEYGVGDVYTSYDEMLTGRYLDGVILVTPHATHAELAIQAMAAHLDVFGEKPMADNLDDCLWMLRAAQTYGVTLGVNYLYAGWSPWAKGQINAGAIGDIHGARVRWTRANGIPTQEAFWTDPDAGVLRDLFGHLVSMVEPIIPGQLVRARATASRDAGVQRHGATFTAWDTIHAEVQSSAGCVVKIDGSWADGGPADEDIEMIVHGDGGQLEVKYPGERTDVGTLLPVLRPTGGRAAFGPDPDVYTTVAMRHALNWHRACASQGREPLVFTAQDAYRVECVVHAIGEATHTDDWVDIAA